MSRILLVEDHEHLAKLICKGLASAGIAADVVSSSGAAWHAIQQVPYQILILDRGLPDGDGLILLQRIRQTQFMIPCLMLTARDALHDRVEGLEAGADDYLSKPFAMEELIARVRALLRRPSALQSLKLNYGDLALSTDTSLMSCFNKCITLAPAELQIMLTLIQKQGEFVRRNTLEVAGWGLTDAVTPNALDVALHRLRQKLLAISTTVQIINLRGQGYALRQNHMAQ